MAGETVRTLVKQTSYLSALEVQLVRLRAIQIQVYSTYFTKCDYNSEEAMPFTGFELYFANHDPLIIEVEFHGDMVADLML